MLFKDNKYLSIYDPKKKTIHTGIFLDVNALYTKLLIGKLPVDGFFELSKEEVAICDINAIDLNRDHCYALVVDFEIPDEIELKTDNLQISIIQEPINIDQASNFTKKLIQ